MSTLFEEVPLVRCELAFNGRALMSFAVHSVPSTDEELVQLLKQMITLLESPKTDYHD